jgi:uncharacterized protein with PhoU and TrkA domain
MPGYASNRLISLVIADKNEVAADVLELQEQIDDLQLNLGV